MSLAWTGGPTIGGPHNGAHRELSVPGPNPKTKHRLHTDCAVSYTGRMHTWDPNETGQPGQAQEFIAISFPLKQARLTENTVAHEADVPQWGNVPEK